LHGAWVAAATAAAVLIFAGGMMASYWLLDPGSLLDAAFGESSFFNPATPANLTVLALVAAGVSGGSVLLMGAITLARRWRKRNGRVPLTNARGEEMETMEETIEKPQRTIEQVTRSNRWLILTVVVLFAALAALGAWVLVDNLVGDESAVDAETEQQINALIDDYFTAWNTGDGQLLLDSFTADGRYVAGHTSGFDGWSGEEIKAGIERRGGPQFGLTKIDTLIIERPDSYHVVLKYRLHEDYDREYFELFNIVDENGSLKFRYIEGLQPLGWFQVAEGLPYQPVTEEG
jgi:hypothetical protein